MKYITGMMLALLISTASCGKNDKAPPAKTAPANLVLSALVNTDNSGSVAFTATADNAVSYDYEFGNGASKTVSNGITNYTYSAGGIFTVKVTAKSSDGLTLSKSAAVTVTIAPGLVWSEEFNTDGAPDPTKWGYDIGTGDNGWGNAEAEYYTDRPANASVSNGILKITAIKENFSGSAYTSARLLTRGKFSFKYGKVEISAKLPAGGGTWPALWMLGANAATIGWPACGEIDIMEHKGNEPNKIYGTVHHPNHAGANADGGTVNVLNETTAFHKYTMDWSPTLIRFYVDDQLFYTFNSAGNAAFDHDFFIILNLAMGGHFGGAIDPAFNSASMEVDYVRVYKN